MDPEQPDNPDKPQKITVSDLFRGDKTTGAVKAYSIVVLILLVAAVAFIISQFVSPDPVFGSAKNGPDRLSVARTEMPLTSHLYRTRNYPYEMQSTVPRRVFSAEPGCASQLSHPEPWDRWNPPKCGGYWFSGTYN